MSPVRPALLSLTLAVAACGGGEGGAPSPDPSGGSTPPPTGASSGGATSSSSGAPAPPTGAAPDAGTPGPLSFVAMTFNTGTSGDSEHDLPPDDGYGSAQAKLSNDHYGNGLAWRAVVDDAKAFFARVSPDVVVFQEIFHSPDCANVPASARAGFVCETWQPGDPTVSQVVLGAGYQVACNLGKPDKCAAVKRGFGAIRGCAGALCIDGLAGATVAGCGGGSRVGRAVIDLARGGSLTLVNVHGSSGMKSEDADCRKKQFRQVFENLDGQPAANGARNLVMGDLNTDPARLALVDESARKLGDWVGQGKAFSFLTEVGSSARPTYTSALVPGLGQGFNIDHVMSDAFAGTCWAAGVTPGHAAVSSIKYFDHHAIVCDVRER